MVLREKPKHLRKVIERVGAIEFDRTPTRFSSDPQYLTTLPLIRDLYRNTTYWHGSGRYKFDSRGEICDVLGAILHDAHIATHQDDWDRKSGTMDTVSVARSRMYARLYAARFCPAGTRIENELGSRELWGAYFFGTSAAVGLAEYPKGALQLLMGSYKKTSVVPNFAEKSKKWGSNVSAQDHTLSETFIYGSDIAENYPILFGIRRDTTIASLNNSRFIALHEVRADTPIPFTEITHLEVPLSKVSEARSLLDSKGHSALPVIPIEYGEEYCRKFTFRQLVGREPLVTAAENRRS